MGGSLQIREDPFDLGGSLQIQEDPFDLSGSVLSDIRDFGGSS